MITVYYEKYRNDFCRKEETKTFSSLEAVADWIFGQMHGDYTKDPYRLYFPTPESLARIHGEGPTRIEFMPERGGVVYWIRMMKEDGGIIFSDGVLTAGKSHWSKAVREWCRNCEERRRAPQFAFTE